MRKKQKQSYFSDLIPKSWTTLKKGYNLKNFQSDLFSSIAVSVVSLPLAMAFAIASGVTPAIGLYTAVIAGLIVSLLGGSNYQIAGPTGAFVVVIYEIVVLYGYDILAIATVFAGIILIIAALSKLGSLVKFIPYPLITGFTTGIALIIFFSQIKDFFGLKIAVMPAAFFPKCAALIHAFPTISIPTTCIAGGTLLMIILLHKFFPLIPWGITSIMTATFISYTLDLPVETIHAKFGELPKMLPFPKMPDFSIIYDHWNVIAQSAITIAFLAGVESLLSAVVADGMTGKTHRSNAELLAQGIANIGSIFFGGIPATGALARTAMNIRSGAKTPISGMIHVIWLLLIMAFFAPIVSLIPLAALSAVLMMVAWNMSDLKHFRHLFKAPLGDIVVLLTTFVLTVVIDLVTAIEVGMVLAAFLFMKNVRDVSGVEALTTLEEGETTKEDPDAIEKRHIPEGVEVYEITGIFFFGLAETLNSIIANLSSPPKVFILRMRKIPMIDASGMHALKEFYYKCKKTNTTLLLSGVSPKVKKSLKKYGLLDLVQESHIYPHIDASLTAASKLIS